MPLLRSALSKPARNDSSCGVSGVECLLELLRDVKLVSSFGAQDPSSVSSRETDVTARWNPFVASGLDKGEESREISWACGVWPNICVSLRFFLMSSARSSLERLLPLLGVRGSVLRAREVTTDGGRLKLGFGVVGTGGLREGDEVALRRSEVVDFRDGFAGCELLDNDTTSTSSW